MTVVHSLQGGIVFVKKELIAAVIFFSVFLAFQSAFAATDVISNGSFESGLTGWTAATNFQAGATGTGSYNGDTAPGIETLTGNAGLAATNGTKIALGSVESTDNTSAITTSVLYQDVAIPAGATTATFTFDIGTKDGVDGGLHTAAKVGIYSTATVPSFNDVLAVGGASVIYSTAADDAVLHSKTSAVNFNISSKAGTTVRFAIMNASQNLAKEVVVVDNVKFMVNAAAPAPSLNEWGMIIFMILLAVSSLIIMKRRRSIQ